MPRDQQAQNSLEIEPDAEVLGPVECLGMVFDDDEARREYFLEKLGEKLQDPEFRKIEGFPIGTDEAILALSDPPYYTACPNPFLAEWLQEHSKLYDPATDTYHREPFAADVSEGRSGLFYDAHSYHTKVPHKAIMRYILHYTEPGDVVYDGFCGTGMTGVAAQLCGDKATVESLGYRVQEDGTVLDEQGRPFSKLGAREAILGDLSPAATFIAYNYNTPVDVAAFEREAKRILKEVEDECGWMYETLHTDGKTKGRINYTVWSDVFVCPECSSEVVFWEAAADKEVGKVHDEFPCPHCRVTLTKRRMGHAWVAKFDKAINQTIRQVKQVPVLINYSVGKKRNEKEPDAFDLALIEKIEQTDIPYWCPTDRMPEGYNTKQPKVSHGITHTHHFYTKRNLGVLAALRNLTNTSGFRHALSFLLNSYDPVHSTVMTRIIFKSGGRKPVLTGYQTGTLYVSSLPVEKNLLEGILSRKLPIVQQSLSCVQQWNTISTSSTDSISPSLEWADYVFTDPPFGGNLMYSELNFLWEAWLRVFTNNRPEAITNKTQHKGLPEYQGLMTRCFAQYYQALKPGRWMTLVFHNSAEAVWNAIQEALQLAGFVLADVRVLDKQQGSFNQVTSTGAVKQDLIISCYKLRAEFEKRFAAHQGEPEGAVEFVRQHLTMLPVAPHTAGGRLEVLAERTKYVLFDRMVGYHLVRGAHIPMSATEFYRLLDQEFIERDGMYFLPDQAVRYDAERIRTEVEPLSLFVRDERSAVRWLRTRLSECPATLGELTPAYMQELQAMDAWEEVPELADLLKENFLREPDGTWRVPDPDREKDVEAMRRKGLLKTFAGYVETRGRLKTFRTEALLEGFRHCWGTRQFGVIVSVCEKIPAKTLQAIPELLQFYDIARDRAPQSLEQLTFTWEG